MSSINDLNSETPDVLDEELSALSAELGIKQYDELEIKNVLQNVSSQIQANIPGGVKRFAEFESAFNQRFPETTPSRSFAKVVTWGLLNAPLALFFIGQNPAVFIELYGLLESFARYYLPALLVVKEKNALVVASLLRRKTLPELAESLLEVGAWNKEDVRFARKLTHIRNGLAHKNAKLLSRHLGDGRNLGIGDAMKLTTKLNCVPYLINTISLLVKLWWSFVLIGYGGSDET